MGFIHPLGVLMLPLGLWPSGIIKTPLGCIKLIFPCDGVEQYLIIYLYILLQGFLAPCGLSFVDTIVKFSAAQWADTVPVLLPCLMIKTS